LFVFSKYGRVLDTFLGSQCQETQRVHAFIKKLERFILEVLVEIDEHIAAKDNLELIE
jgi:hypothetical protein